MVSAPWDGATVQIVLTKHFAMKYAARWGWDARDVRDAIQSAYRIDKVGKEKYELYVEKQGYKKIVTVYWADDGTIVCITGSTGGKRE